jgi:hypothetical protein
MSSDARDTTAAVGLFIAAIGPIMIAGTLVPLRGDMSHANVALVYVVLVVVAAACGGRWVGAIAAIVSTLSFDFFFTRPYQSLKIARADDVGTTVLLLIVGLLVGEIVVRANRARTTRDRGRAEIARLHRVAEQVASGVPTGRVRETVETELIDLLRLRDCFFEHQPYATSLPRLERSGAMPARVHRFAGGEFTLPADGADIAVLGRGQEAGRLVLIPDPELGASLEARVVAIALADQLGAAIAADHPYGAGNGARPY